MVDSYKYVTGGASHAEQSTFTEAHAHFSDDIEHEEGPYGAPFNTCITHNMY